MQYLLVQEGAAATETPFSASPGSALPSVAIALAEQTEGPWATKVQPVNNYGW